MIAETSPGSINSLQGVSEVQIFLVRQILKFLSTRLSQGYTGQLVSPHVLPLIHEVKSEAEAKRCKPLRYNVNFRIGIRRAVSECLRSNQKA